MILRTAITTSLGVVFSKGLSAEDYAAYAFSSDYSIAQM